MCTGHYYGCWELWAENSILPEQTFTSYSKMTMQMITIEPHFTGSAVGNLDRKVLHKAFTDIGLGHLLLPNSTVDDLFATYEEAL